MSDSPAARVRRALTLLAEEGLSFDQALAETLHRVRLYEDEREVWQRVLVEFAGVWREAWGESGEGFPTASCRIQIALERIAERETPHP